MGIHPAICTLEPTHLEFQIAGLALKHALCQRYKGALIFRCHKLRYLLAEDLIQRIRFDHVQPGTVDLQQRSVCCHQFYALRFGFNDGV